jgi:hypothetical protein
LRALFDGLAYCLLKLYALQRALGSGAQVQKVLDVSGRAWQRAGGDTGGVPPQFGGAPRDGKHGICAQLGVRHDSTCADSILTDLKLWLHHRNDIRVV